ncbi:MAG: hypothetical protein SNJ52_01490, partial [Verrucomicrobiia bacterium]
LRYDPSPTSGEAEVMVERDMAKVSIEGTLVTEEHYLRGGMDRVVWTDFRTIPFLTRRNHIEARLQAQGLARRLDRAIATGKPVLLVTHTVPWPELNAWPVRGGTLRVIAHAYTGNTQVAEVIASRAAAVELLVCGHTHLETPELILHGIR